jgi:hypothetical protein
MNSAILNKTRNWLFIASILVIVSSCQPATKPLGKSPNNPYRFPNSSNLIVMPGDSTYVSYKVPAESLGISLEERNRLKSNKSNFQIKIIGMPENWSVNSSDIVLERVELERVRNSSSFIDYIGFVFEVKASHNLMLNTQDIVIEVRYKENPENLLIIPCSSPEIA